MTIETVFVVIPARNESALISRCLRSLELAVEVLQYGPAPPSVHIVVVLDRCTDDTAELVSSFGWVDTVEVDAGSVGVARSVGVASALARLQVETDRAWIANTDADSAVPPQWLVEQVRLANSGADVVIGSVSPVMADLTDDLADAWHRVRRRRSPAGHVHGANLGFRASSYIVAGGFTSEALHEDVSLVARMSAASAAVCSSLDIDVTTSGRKQNRLSGGYASYLHDGSLVSRAFSEDLTG
ncbi:MAG: glycosyltransferase family 2 protein [Actinomycetota bacterium]